MSGRSKFEMTHFPALDGLRGLAILSVMLYHFCHVPVVSHNVVDAIFYKIGIMGWVGVDLFFVISGFLITTILLRTRGLRRYFSVFYMRRVLRIFPLYYGYLIVLTFAFTVAAWVGVVPKSGVPWSLAGQFWLWTYLANFATFATGTPVSPAAGHFWSLAVEEQFYLLWPLTVYALPRRHLLVLTIGLIVAAPIVRSALIVGGFSGLQVYVLTFSRMDASAWGALVAILLAMFPAGQPLKYAGLAFCAAAPLAIATLVFWGPRGDTNALMSGAGLSIFPLAFSAALAITVRDNRSLIARGLERPILKFFGKYSYGLYVTHVIVRAAALAVIPAPFLLWQSQLAWQLTFMIVAGAASVTVAVLSWHLYERHWLALKRYFPYTADNSERTVDADGPPMLSWPAASDRAPVQASVTARTASRSASH
jgi:peptidoglycan/LPS O-acetylase OafA/YrhL